MIKPYSHSQGLKALITTTALAATLAGWALLVTQTQPVPDAPQPTPANQAAIVAPPPAWLLTPPAIPELPPVATAQIAPRVTVVTTAPQPAVPAPVQAAPVQAAPVQAAPVAPAPALREVASIPAPAPPVAPAPVTTTRSSR